MGDYRSGKTASSGRDQKATRQADSFQTDAQPTVSREGTLPAQTPHFRPNLAGNPHGPVHAQEGRATPQRWRQVSRELGLKRIIPLAVLCAVALAPAAAYADPLGIQYAGTGNGQTITVNYNNNFESTFAGELEWAWVGTPPAGWDSTFYSYCGDLTHEANWSQTVTLNSTTAKIG